MKLLAISLVFSSLYAQQKSKKQPMFCGSTLFTFVWDEQLDIKQS